MLYFFVNPASRSGKGAAKWEQVRQLLNKKNISYQVHFLEKDISPRPVMETIFATERAAVSLVLIGGDGTINQCLNAIPDFKRVELSIIPTGSGNDFGRNKAIPKKLEEQIFNIHTRKNLQQIDVGRVTYALTDHTTHSRHFLVSTGFGYDAAICYMAERSTLKKRLNKLKLGKLVYLAIGVKEIFGAKLTDMEITIDGKTEFYHDVFFIASMNQPYEGGGVAMTPDASDTDGLLNFMIYSGRTKFQALCTIPLLYIKKHAGKPGVTLLSGKEVAVTSSAPRILHYDGDTLDGCTCFEASLTDKITFVS